MSHPESCTDPTCTLSYRDHLIGLHIGAGAQPTRRPEVVQTNIREKRWHRDHAAFRRLYKDGMHPPKIDGAALRERQGETEYDINHRPVNIDYTDPA